MFKQIANSIKNYLLRCLIAIFLTCMAMHVAAEQGKWKIELGGGSIVNQTAWQDMPNDTLVVPNINVEYGNWRFGVKYGLVNYRLTKDTFETAISLDYRDETYDSDLRFNDELSDNIVFKGYQDNGGEAVVRLHAKLGIFQAVIAQDISDESDGVTADVKMELPLYLGQRGKRVMMELGAYWLDKKYANHIYGVTAQQANPFVGRDQYLLDEGVTNPYISLTGIYPFSRSLALVASYKYQKMDQLIQDSPLVGEKLQQQFMLMVSYKL